MVRLKGCPRCKGDLISTRGRDGWTEQCLQCGYERAINNDNSMPQPRKVISERPEKEADFSTVGDQC